MRLIFLSAVSACLLGAEAPPSAAQQPAPAAVQRFQLAALQDAAVQADPRLRQRQLQAMQSAQRLQGIANGRLPAVSLEGLAQYQSDVPTSPINLPNGQPAFSASKSIQDGSLRIDQRIFDSTLGTQEAVERAHLAEAQAGVNVALFGLRQQVNDAFFAAASLQERTGALAATVADLEARLRETSIRVREGAALADEAAAVEATLLQRRQDEEELRANRRAALARLSKLTAQTIADGDALVLPDLTAAVAAARRAPDDIRARPEYEQFARTRDRLARQQDAASAIERPRVSAFGRVGYGRPGLNFISNEFEAYGLGGVQIQWKAWTWGSASHEREALGLGQQIVAADQAAFTKGLGEAIEGDLATIDHLRSALAIDERIIALREQIERGTGLRFREAVVTVSEYLDRSSELLQARFARGDHRVGLAQASARFLTTLGLEVR